MQPPGTIPSMKNAPDRRRDLIDAGRRLILESGYTATTVDAVCRAAGVTKGAFFHHFDSKEEFAAEILIATWQPVVDGHSNVAASAEIDEVGRHIRFMISWMCESGRLMPLLAQELGATNPRIGQQVRGYFETWMDLLLNRLEAAAAALGTTPDIEALKDFVVAATEGVPTARAQFGDEVVGHVADHLVAAVIAGLQADV